MRPGQLNPNDLEVAILGKLLASWKSSDISQLHVLSREFTGVGSYTKFSMPAGAESKESDSVGLTDLINVPGVPNGLGAVLWLRADVPETLELYTFGSEHWDGRYEGFSLGSA